MSAIHIQSQNDNCKINKAVKDEKEKLRRLNLYQESLSNCCNFFFKCRIIMYIMFTL